MRGGRVAAARAPPSASPSALGRGPRGRRPPARAWRIRGGGRPAPSGSGWGGGAPRRCASPSLGLQQQVAATWPWRPGYCKGRAGHARTVAVGAWVCATRSHPRGILGTWGRGRRRSLLLPLVSLSLIPGFLLLRCADCLFPLEARVTQLAAFRSSFLNAQQMTRGVRCREQLHAVQTKPGVGSSPPCPLPVPSCRHWGRAL